jgi:uncharacterized protein (DUF2336 family)
MIRGMTGSLSHADVARLLADPSAEARAVLAGKLGTVLDGAGLATQELAIALDIVRALARDIEVAVRSALSHSLRHSGQLPHDVAMRLAADVERVALPVLTDSLVLTDDDLIEIVRTGSPHKQVAVAAREALAEDVADAVTLHGAEQAVAALMANPTARISEAGLNTAVDRFRHSRAVTEGMAIRKTLPMTVAERLVTLVSRRLQDHLVRAHELSSDTASNLVLRGREQALIRLSAGANEADLLRMVSQMHHSGRLTPTLVLRALCTGDIGFFEAAMAARADLPIGNTQARIHDPGHNGLLSLYRKAEMPLALLPVIRAAIEAVDETGFDGRSHDLERFRVRIMTRVLTQAESLDPADADYLVEKLGEVMAVA